MNAGCVVNFSMPYHVRPVFISFREVHPNSTASCSLLCAFCLANEIFVFENCYHREEQALCTHYFLIFFSSFFCKFQMTATPCLHRLRPLRVLCENNFLNEK